MTKTYYCGEGQSTASITIDDIEYTTNKPPISVEQIESVTLVGQVFRARFPYGLFEEESLPLVSVGAWGLRSRYLQDAIEVDIQLHINGVPAQTIYKTNSYPYTGAPPYNPRGLVGAIIYYNTTSQTTPAKLEVKDKDSNLIISIPGTPTYTINCDGCGVGECKGNRARYPGYDCLNCAELKRKLQTIGRRMDGITKR
jgi:hypothetical protein